MTNIPLNVLGLNVPSMTFQNNNITVTRPITDHPLVIQNTYWGAIGTINILNPGSPFAPPAQIGGVNKLPEQGKVQMELMAEYIFEMFKQGIGLLALQEVPVPKSENFGFLRDKLKSLTGTSNLIDVDALTTQWLKTEPHSFGTSLICNPKHFHISSNALPALNKRAAVYQVTSVNGQVIPIANIHGDYKMQFDTVKYVANFDGFCLGDSNVTYSAFSPAQAENVLQSIERPKLRIESKECTINTVDFIQDTYSKKFSSAFTPAIDGITKLQNTEESIFQPIVVKISSVKAIHLLKAFTSYLNKVQPELIYLGKIADVDLKTPKPGNISHITIHNKIVCQKYNQFMKEFDDKKNKIQSEFIHQLNALDKKISDYSKKGSASYNKGKELCETLIDSQKSFFKAVTLDASSNSIQTNIANFRKICEQNVCDADRIMGHGWLYRIVEVILKTVAGLCAGIGMVLGIIGGQGLANPQHRQAYRDSFLILNQSKGTKALQEFKQTVLGENELELGLLCEDKLTPKYL